MFADYPSLFGRDFAVGHFIPAVAALVLALALFSAAEPNSELSEYLEAELLTTVAVGVLVAWLLAIVLMALNRNLIRFLEGYGSSNPLNAIGWFRSRQVTRFKTLCAREESTKSRYLEVRKRLVAAKDSGAPEVDELEKQRGALATELGRLQLELSRDFPDRERFVLPTSFGNRVRAFEVYSRVVYGLDAIGGWERLQIIVPSENREFVGHSKAVVDFWVNVHTLSGLLAIWLFIAAFLDLPDLSWSYWIAGLMAAITSWVALRFAGNAVIEWGGDVKALIDVYRLELAEKLGYQRPADHHVERKMWEDITKAFLYRSNEALGRADKYRSVPDSSNGEDFEDQ